MSTFVDAFRTIFPEGAGYEHDQLDRRSDLDAIQRTCEPKNADSHLAFMASGLRPCVTHPNREGEAVCFVDLDGVVDGRPRLRRLSLSQRTYSFPLTTKVIDVGSHWPGSGSSGSGICGNVSRTKLAISSYDRSARSKVRTAISLSMLASDS